ncbi:MAG: hypothetical protein ABIK48_06520 [candidate division WOR-3 bacterium]
MCSPFRLYGGWVRLANFYGHATGPGTAIAAGRGLETGSPTPDATTLLWLLHGRDSDEINFFERWYAPSGPPGSWARRQNLPWEDPRRDKVDWGAALCQAGDTFYAVFGRDNEPQFWCYYDSQEPDGSQSVDRISALPSVMLLPSGREYQIVVNDVSGSVNLTVFSVAGTVMKRLSECPISGRCVLRLDTGHWQTGIYYWRLETSAGVTAGKVTVIH